MKLKEIINREDFVADDWKWVKEKWYDRFKEKYPNGVLCWVWYSYPHTPIYKRVVLDYDSTLQLFKTDTGTMVYAIPIEPEEAPAIIGGLR